ncbi:DUF2487 family protein [Paenibacillus hamazuiensis]|uniref:DUF2487 family protein n=1 Tax=Paenibacillus hamazuiensis TaxID=2936508 RepID=UPI00200EB520|nr:DUF2487 family protein [Paenibacillus hamazuiensis]
MKFSDISKEQWDELRTYLDTCLLPVTGLAGSEAPHEAAEKLERLRDLLDLVEIPFKGRVVTYPAYHFIDDPLEAERLNRLCQRLKDEAGFRYLLVMSESVPLHTVNLPSADLIVHVGSEGLSLDSAAVRLRIAGEVGAMWQTAKNLNPGV